MPHSANHLQKLTAMGFGRGAAVAALERNADDLTAALNELMANPDAASQSEPEAEPQQAGGHTKGGRCCFTSEDTVERLQIRLEHQQATLTMLRGAGASEEELRVLLRDVELLEERIRTLRTEAAAMRDAADVAEQKRQAAAAKKRMEEEALAQRNRLAEENAKAAKAVTDAKIVAASAEAEAQRLAADKAMQELAKLESRLDAAEGALSAEVQERQRLEKEAREAETKRLVAEERLQEVVDQGVNSLSESMATWVEGRYTVEMQDTVDERDEAGYSHTVYRMLYTDPTLTGQNQNGRKVPPLLVQKRYSEFAALKATLECELPQLAGLDFPEKTWTTWGAQWASTVDGRKTRLAAWLNHVLFLHSPSENEALAAFLRPRVAAGAEPADVPASEQTDTADLAG